MYPIKIKASAGTTDRVLECRHEKPKGILLPMVTEQYPATGDLRFMIDFARRRPTILKHNEPMKLSQWETEGLEPTAFIICDGCNEMLPSTVEKKQKTCHLRDGITRCGQPAKFVIRNYFRGAPLKGQIGTDDYYACESCHLNDVYWRLICEAIEEDGPIYSRWPLDDRLVVLEKLD
jgi:hypothetical protein